MRRLLTAACLLCLPIGLSAAEPDPETSVTLGKPAPDFTVTGIDGKTFQLSDKTKAGKHVALMFSRAHW
jgi:hypothetical protein